MTPQSTIVKFTDAQGRSCAQSYHQDEFTLESTPVNDGFIACDSPSAVSGLSHQDHFTLESTPVNDAWDSPFSPQRSHIFSSDCGVDDGNDLKFKLRELEVSLLGPESDIVDSLYCCYKGDKARWNETEIAEMVPKLNIKNVLIRSAHAISEAANCMEVLGHMVSVSGIKDNLFPRIQLAVG